MKRQWTEAELDAHWALAAQEEALLVGCSGHGRFGFVVLLKFFQYEGRFPESRREIPADVMCYLATQLGMPLNTLDDFDWQGRTAMRQRAEILEWLGIRRMEESDWHALAGLSHQIFWFKMVRREWLPQPAFLRRPLMLEPLKWCFFAQLSKFRAAWRMVAMFCGA